MLSTVAPLALRSCVQVKTRSVPPALKKHPGMRALASSGTRDETGIETSGGAMMVTDGTGTVARVIDMGYGALIVPRKLATTSTKSKREPPSSSAPPSVTIDVVPPETDPSASETRARLSQVRGDALHWNESGRAPPPVLREASSMTVVPGQLPMTDGAWMRARGVIHISRSSVARLSHGKKSSTRTVAPRKHKASAALQVPTNAWGQITLDLTVTVMPLLAWESMVSSAKRVQSSSQSQ